MKKKQGKVKKPVNGHSAAVNKPQTALPPTMQQRSVQNTAKAVKKQKKKPIRQA